MSTEKPPSELSKGDLRCWRQRAHQMRMMAQCTSDSDVEAQMMQLAQAYETIARKADQKIKR
jgi:hypothetical protein